MGGEGEDIDRVRYRGAEGVLALGDRLEEAAAARAAFGDCCSVLGLTSPSPGLSRVPSGHRTGKGRRREV